MSPIFLQLLKKQSHRHILNAQGILVVFHSISNTQPVSPFTTECCHKSTGVLQTFVYLYRHQRMHSLCNTLTFSCLCFTSFFPFAALDTALDILAGEQGSSVFGSMGADV